MATQDFDKRIRAGLKFLRKTDKAIIRSSKPLERLTGLTPQGVNDLLRIYNFRVDGNVYQGTMTRAQKAYLDGHKDSLEHFADAIAEVLLGVDEKVVEALQALCDALPEFKARRGAAGPVRVAGGVPKVGCCTYDNTMRDGVTQSFCEGGLLGTWNQNPCRPF